MSLANIDVNDMRRRILAAAEKDHHRLEELRVDARTLAAGIEPLRPYAGNAVSFVASDGGDNRLVFNPSTIELVRVVDSRGNQCALDAVSGSFTVTDLQRRVDDPQEGVAPLRRLCNDLGLDLYELSYLVRGAGQPGKSTGALRAYRDLVEWAVLYDLVCNPSLQWGGDTVLVRDGLLRSKAFTRRAFPQMERRLRESVKAHARRNVNVYVVGVAKQSAVLSRLAVALELEGVFHRDYPCYVEVPEEIEAKCYNFDRTWLDTYESAEEDDQGNKLYQSMGQLFLVKFGDQRNDPVWPVDVAVWQVSDAPQILGLLTRDAQQGFPVPDYPMCLQRAHDFAKLTGLEIEIMQDMLLESVSAHLGDAEAERLLRMMYLGRNLQSLRYKEA